VETPLSAVTSGRCFQTALRVLGNAEDAEDALQDGMLSAYRNLKRFEGRSQFSTWLTRIRDQRGADAAAQRKGAAGGFAGRIAARDELPAAERFADDGPNPEQVFASTEIREMISENLDELSPLLRTAFCVARKCQGYSTAKRTKKLGVTENTLKARLWRARHQLAERLRTGGLRRMKDDISNAGGMGDAEVQLLLRDEVKEVQEAWRK